MNGTELIAAERHRQVDKEGFNARRDDTYGKGELAMAAACYAFDPREDRSKPPENWIWDPSFWKPADPREGVDGRLRELEKAGALIAAEIDRLLRLKAGG